MTALNPIRAGFSEGKRGEIAQTERI
jgi:hypothetical protein